MVKPADQAHVSAVTEDGRQSASTIERAARAARLRDYFALQLHFAEMVAARTALPLADAVAQYTNFYRRFGFGLWHAPIASAWQQYTAHLLTLEMHDQRVAWTQAFYAQLPPELLPPGRQQFGGFGCDPPDADGRVRIHFTNHDTDGTSLLSRAKMGARRQELYTIN